MKTYLHTRCALRTYFFFSLSMLPLLLPAITRSSFGGAWNNPNTWMPNGVPQNGDNIIIAGEVIIDGYTVNLDNATLTIQNGGTLVFDEVIFFCGFSFCGIDFGKLYLTGNSGIVVETGGQITADQYWFTLIFININGEIVWNAGQGTVNGPESFPAGFLPVKLTAFSATPKDNGWVALNWTTASEINNAGFELQRSYDALDWEYVTFVPGQGSATERVHYEYLDHLPANMESSYYRLRQQDFDGAIEYSPVISVTLNNTGLLSLKLYPNPAGATLNIVSSAGRAVIYSPIGQPLQALELPLGTTNLNIADLPAGSYILQLEMENGERISRPFVKSR